MTRSGGKPSRIGRVAAIGALVSLGLVSASMANAESDDWAMSEHPGGSFTVYSFGQSPYTRSASFLVLEDRQRVSDGSKAFREVPAGDPLDAPATPATLVAPATPTMQATQDHNAPSCEACHVRNGRGLAHAALFSETGFSVPIQTQSSAAPVFRSPVTHGPAVSKLEGITWRVKRTVFLSDGTKVELVAPLAIINGERSQADLRNAPGVYGLGLIEAISDRAIRELAQSRPYARLGIAGVLAVSETAEKVGRFGWKGRFSSLDAQVHSAIVNEIGIADRPAGSPGFDDLQNALTSYMRWLAVPARRPSSGGEYRRGAQAFARIGCSMCHQPTWRTTNADDAPPELRDQVIHPFTDLLLHDMGDGLRDCNDNDLSRLWRTPALWGIGMQPAVSDRAGFLHDGRARNLLEAVLWHGGEAATTMRRFETLSTHERHDLLTFLSSL